MSSKYILMECNRLNSQKNYKNINESEDVFKNKWTNNVNSTGIVVNIGDIINCESSAINTQGASDNTMEFLNKETQKGFVDSEAEFNFTYYVNNIGINTIKLPMINAKTYYGIVRTENPTDSTYLINRYLGEPYIMGTDDGRPQNSGSSDFGGNMPTTFYVNHFTLSTVEGEIGTGYEQNALYNAQIVGNLPAGNKMVFQCLSIQSEGGGGNDSGIPTGFRIFSMNGFQMANSGNEFQFILNSRADGGTPFSGRSQMLNVQSIVSNNMFSKSNTGADNKRYFLANKGYSGSSICDYVGVPTKNQIIQTGTDFDLNWSKSNKTFSPRSCDVAFTVPSGLETPDNIASILTNQMTTPTTLSVADGSEFINYKDYKTRSQNEYGEIDLNRPTIIESSVYKPTSVNFGKKNSQVGTTTSEDAIQINNFIGSYQNYYANIGFEEPERIEGLQCFRQFVYNTNVDDPKNQFYGGAKEVVDRGDWNNQFIGNHGLHTILMMSLPHNNVVGEGTGIYNNYIQYPKGGWVLTNLYFTEENIKKIAQGFKKSEKYFGDLTEKYDLESSNYNDNLAVALDLGYYFDEDSMGEGIPNNDSLGVTTHYRYRFKSFWEKTAYQTNNNIVGSDPNKIISEINYRVVNGSFSPLPQSDSTVPFAQYKHHDGNKNNDGQELPSLVVSSRYSNYIPFDTNNVDPSYTALYNIISEYPYSETETDPLMDRFTIQGSDGTKQSIDDTFERTYTDPTTGNHTTSDLIALAKKYDICAIPVYPKEVRLNFNYQGGRPFIAFRSHLKIDVPDGSDFASNPIKNGTPYDTTINGTEQSWQIWRHHCNYGTPMGFDVSKIRNNSVMLFNTNFAVKGGSSNNNSNFANIDGNTYNSVMMIGAVNPTIDFDTSLSRFTIKGLNTPITIGNGIPTDNQDNLTATTDPEQQVYNLNVVGAIGGIKYDTINNQNPAYNIEISQHNVKQNPQSICDSYSGISLVGITLFDSQGNKTKLLSNNMYDNTYNDQNTEDDYFKKYQSDIINDNLIDKMGFVLDDLLIPYGHNQNNLTDPYIIEKNNLTFREKLNREIKPLTTSSRIGTPEYQPSSANSLNYPLYGLGTNMGLTSRPSVEQAIIVGKNLPSKLDYPYLLIYSSIIQGGTDTEFYGGQDGKSRLPCIGYITRNYNIGDFFYGLQQSFTYTANKSFVLSEIDTEIRLPDGSSPRLQPHNSVIYKITKNVQPIGILPQNNIFNNNNNTNKQRDDQRKKIQEIQESNKRI